MDRTNPELETAYIRRGPLLFAIPVAAAVPEPAVERLGECLPTESALRGDSSIGVLFRLGEAISPAKTTVARRVIWDPRSL